MNTSLAILISLATSSTDLRASCEHGNASACLQLARNEMQGRGGLAIDLEDVAVLLARACGPGAPRACSKFGAMVLAGQGIDVNRALATRAFKRGCDLRDGESCSALAQLLEDKDVPSSLHLLRYACESLDAQSACRELGRILIFNKGAEAYRSEGRALLLSACRRHDGTACLLVGLATDNGKTATAAAWYRRGCVLGVADACALLGDVTLSPAQAPEQAWALRRACDLGAGNSCLALAILAHDQQHDEEADRLIDVACSNGCQFACDTVTKFLDVSGPV